MITKLKTLGNKARTSAFLAASTLATAAMAGTTDPFDTAVADIKTKVAAYAAALVGVAAVSVGFMVGVKYVKKIRGSA